MTNDYGLQRERIAATLDKRALAQAIAVVVDALVKGTETAKSNFWINVELNAHIQAGRVLDRHARITAYIPSTFPSPRSTGKVQAPSLACRIKIPAALDEVIVARSMAWVVRTLLTAVETERDDFWVNIDLNVHIKRGKAYEKKARINVFGDLLDTYGTTIVDTIEQNEIPLEVLQGFCEDFERREE